MYWLTRVVSKSGAIACALKFLTTVGLRWYAFGSVCYFLAVAGSENGQQGEKQGFVHGGGFKFNWFLGIPQKKRFNQH